MTLAGIDVSAAGQGPNFPWESYRGKIQFAGVKVSEGLGYADPFAKINIAGARAIGCTVIGYHFLHAGQPGGQQAEWFLKCAKAAGLGRAGDIIAIDAEDLGLDGGRPALMNGAATTFALQLRTHFPAYWPVLYTEISLAPVFTLRNCPLWLANPSRAHTGQLGPWAGPSFEQVGQVGVDTDVFYGDRAALAKLAFK